MSRKIIVMALLCLTIQTKAQPVYTNNYSSTAGWQMNGTGYSILSVFDFNYTECTSYNYATHSLGATISNDAWTADIEFMYVDRGSGGVAHVLLGITAGALNSWNVGSSYAVSNEDVIEAYINCPYGSPQNNDSLFGRSKDGNVWNLNSKGIAIQEYTQYYMRLQRTSPTTGRISLFLDEARTIHAPGSPQEFPVKCTVKNLNTVEHGCIPQGWYTRQLRGALDNLSIKNDSASGPLPFTSSAQVQDILCYGNKGSIAIMNSGGTSPFYYSWSNGATGTGLNSQSQLPAGNYSVTVTDSLQCTTTIEIALAQPTPLFAGISHDTSCGKTVASIVHAAGGQPPYKYNWSTSFASSTLNEPLPGTYSVIVTDSNQCSLIIYDTVASVESTLSISDIEVVNIFTPNNDGCNDTFFPFSLKNKSTVSSPINYNLYMYDRWGLPVYSTTRPGLAWDGKISGGPASDGTYYWIAEIFLNECNGEEKKTMKGFVTLQR